MQRLLAKEARTSDESDLNFSDVVDDVDDDQEYQQPVEKHTRTK